MTGRGTTTIRLGGPIMIILLALLFRLFLRQRLLEAARTQAAKGRAARWRAMRRWT